MNHFEKYESYIPVDLLEPKSFLLAVVVMFFIIMFRYFLVAGLFWLLFYKFPNAQRKARLIYKKLPSTSEQLFEIKWSTYSTFIFALAGAALGLLWQSGYSRIYLGFNEYPIWWMPISFVLISILHDFYFYWTHRFLHIPWIYKRYHAVHHASLTPSPWASFSFHPVESLLEAVPLPLILCLVPAHPTVIIVYLSFMTFSAVTNHLGFEILPKGSADNFFGKQFISGVHHSQHHRYYNYNFALFYTFWDRVFKTQHSDYEKQFNQVVKS